MCNVLVCRYEELRNLKARQGNVQLDVLNF